MKIVLAQERFERILEILREKQSVTVSDLTNWLNTSESTIRRDLTELSRQGLLVKVHGGATAVKSVLSREEEVITKSKKHQREKREIGSYAASLIRQDDMVYLDAGTTTEMMIDFLNERDVLYVTNGITHARKLMNAGFNVHLIGGEIKSITEALVGEEAIEQLDRYNFTKGFFGTNGIDEQRGLSTPDMKEAAVKRKAFQQCQQRYVLTDQSKFDQISAFKFADLNKAGIITEHLSNKKYKEMTTIKEVF